MNTRIRELRKHLGITLEEFGKKLGVTRAAVSNIENGNRNVTDQMIISICREFNVNEEWLQNGTGEMFKELSDEVGYYVADLLDYEGEGNPLYDMIIEMMKKYHDLDDKSKEIMKEYFGNVMDSMTNKKKKED